ncbi:RNA-binding (RRM/RBD/RNP motifs) family protein [Trifolium repens]|nr:RNA-binding (RRM/RBD/RNP motifs) family protein [Trifolium repens]
MLEGAMSRICVKNLPKYVVEDRPREIVSQKGEITDVNLRTMEVELKEHFSQFGDVLQVHLVVDRETNRPKEIAYIHFSDPDFAARALKESNNSIFQGRLLHVMPAIPGLFKQ